mgnify:CR=1 FL=1
MVDEIHVYIGPSIRGVIQKGTIFPGSRAEVEAFLEGAIQKYPRIKSLIVSGDTLAADRISVNTPGTRLSTEYGRLVAEVKIRR